MAQPKTRRPAVKEQQRIGDEAVEKATGKKWDAWFRVLDTYGADRRGHKATAQWLAKEQGLNGWWSQSVAIQHEWVRGLRVRSTLRFDGKEIPGDLIADGEQVTFRGEEYSLGIPVAKVTKAEAKGVDVHVTFHRGTAVFAEVGTSAAQWAKRFSGA